VGVEGDHHEPTAGSELTVTGEQVFGHEGDLDGHRRPAGFHHPGLELDELALADRYMEVDLLR
jgi:hypothetical protein